MQATIELLQPAKCDDLERYLYKREFIVRSAYHLEKERQDLLRGEGSNNLGGSGIWSLIWNLKLLNAVKMFMWRACHYILPTKANLLKRGIVNEHFCPIRGIDGESILHILWSCQSAMNV